MVQTNIDTRNYGNIDVGISNVAILYCFSNDWDQYG